MPDLMPPQKPAAAVRSVCVFCASRMGSDPVARDAAIAMGRGLAEAGMRLVYGGGRNGLMGALADGALERGGAVSGIIPDFLRSHERAHHGVTDLVVTATMHERKALMFAQSDAFVTLPGGLGTLDETVEVITWRQLRLHDKPILVVNLNGWADRLATILDSFIEAGFAEPASRQLYEIVPDVATALRLLSDLPASQPGQPARL